MTWYSFLDGIATSAFQGIKRVTDQVEAKGILAHQV